MKKYIFFNLLFAVVFLTNLSLTKESLAQAGCSIIKTNCPPSDLSPVCANSTQSGIVGSTVSWTPPHFSLSCSSGGLAFQMSFDLPEVHNNCWLYSRVKRVGTDGGRLRLWQSTQSNSNPNPNFTTPSFFLPASATNCSMTIANCLYFFFNISTIMGL